VGSIIAGSKEFIERARKFRKLLGGGMRQVGVLAAAGIVALEEMVDRLAEDHQRAQRLAEGLSQVCGIKVADTNYRTNILLVDVEGTGLSAPEFSSRLKALGLWINPKSGTTLRIVVHRHIEDSDVDRVIEAFREIAAS